jgi:GNAT superfamily N-acetyltransferase
MAYAIVPATEQLLSEIEAWLDEEQRQYNSGERDQNGFRCNWDSTVAAWSRGGAKVDVLMVDGKAIGFLSDTDILEIHPDHRARGYGRLLSEHMLKRAYNEGFCVVEIQIAPETAEPFWVRQGFVADRLDLNYRNGLYAYKKLPRSFALGTGAGVLVQIAFYDEDVAYKGGAPFTTFAGIGERLSNGVIQLPERVIGFDPTLKDNTENHIRITVSGQETYFGRSKYGGDHGAARDPHGYHFIDRIVIG